MNKRIVNLLLALVMVLSLAACGKTPRPPLNPRVTRRSL